MKVAYIGNFSGAPFTTENDIRETIMGLGHEVIKIQENQWDGTDNLMNTGSQVPQLDLLVYTHTHGWGPPQDKVRAFLRRCSEHNVPTVGFHLDLWRGLPRAVQLGTQAFFSCDYVFSPDGGDPALWESHGIEHIYSPPGVLESSCYLAQPDPAQEHDVIFVGSRGYHPEHAYRGRLIEWLEKRYGSRFRLYEHSSGMRMDRLNVLYASARCVVGDSCFAGKVPGYTSDRFPETLGRGGLLVYPSIDGITDGAPCETHEPEDLGSLEAAIERVLALTPGEAMERRHAAIEFVLSGWTYRHRWEAIFDRLRADGVVS